MSLLFLLGLALQVLLGLVELLHYELFLLGELVVTGKGSLSLVVDARVLVRLLLGGLLLKVYVGSFYRLLVS